MTTSSRIFNDSARARKIINPLLLYSGGPRILHYRRHQRQRPTHRGQMTVGRATGRDTLPPPQEETGGVVGLGSRRRAICLGGGRNHGDRIITSHARPRRSRILNYCPVRSAVRAAPVYSGEPWLIYLRLPPHPLRIPAARGNSASSYTRHTHTHTHTPDTDFREKMKRASTPPRDSIFFYFLANLVLYSIQPYIYAYSLGLQLQCRMMVINTGTKQKGEKRQCTTTRL